MKTNKSVKVSKSPTPANGTNNNSDLIYGVIGLIVLIAPLLMWLGKNIMRKVVDKVVTDTVDPQIHLMKELLGVREKETQTFLSIMDMHIEELRYVTKELRIHEDRIDTNEGKIKELEKKVKL